MSAGGDCRHHPEGGCGCYCQFVGCSPDTCPRPEPAYDVTPHVIAAGMDLAIEPMEGDVQDRFLEGLRRSGLVDQTCAECGRPFMTRRQTSLCPPCDGLAAPECWSCKRTGHNGRDCPAKGKA